MKAKILKPGLMMVFIFLLSSCGGGSGSGTLASLGGIGGTGIVASGPITGFGSIFVNGVEYHTNTATVEFNNATGTTADLKLGMNVFVNATESNGVFTAHTVKFDYSVEGPVSGLKASTDGLSKKFTVLGVNVSVDKTATVFDNSQTFNFASLANNQLVKISGSFKQNNVLIVNGSFNQNNVLIANYIESAGNFVQGMSQVELKGTITGLTGTSFMLGNISVDASGLIMGLPNGLMNNLRVEAKGIMSTATTLKASRIFIETDDLSHSTGKAEVTGFVTNYTNMASFKVDGQTVDASGAILSPTSLALADGTKVEVEGVLTNGVLVATELKSKQQDINIEGIIASLPVSMSGASKQMTLDMGSGNGSITLTANSSTLFDDETHVVGHMSYGDLAAGNFVQIRASKIGTTYIAGAVKRDSPDNQLIKAPLDSISTSDVVVLGIRFSLVNGTTVYQDSNGNQVTQADFIVQATPGKMIKVVDKYGINGFDGVADELELEN
jgi:hypothetical protein